MTSGIELKEIGRRAAHEAERGVMLQVLEEVRWNRMEAARRLQISYKALLYKIRMYELRHLPPGEERGLGPDEPAPVWWTLVHWPGGTTADRLLIAMPGAPRSSGPGARSPQSDERPSTPVRRPEDHRVTLCLDRPPRRFGPRPSRRHRHVDLSPPWARTPSDPGASRPGRVLPGGALDHDGTEPAGVGGRPSEAPRVHRSTGRPA